MIYSGDTVFPNIYNDNILGNCDKNFLEKEKIVNLESLITLESCKKITTGIGLHSSKDIIKFLKDLNVVSISQANNHITDFNTSINKQKEFLKDNNIESFGAGDTIDIAQKAFFYEENRIEYGVISFGWEVISCKAATQTSKGVNPLRYKNVVFQAQEFIKKHPTKKLIIIFHWDYEFELYPQPAHRQLAFELIDMGVNAIIGHHPHIVQGFEVYKNKPIFYSLGNFYFPDANYNGYEMSYSEDAKNGLCVELSEDVRDIVLYWTYLSDNEKLLIIKKENLFESEKLKELSSFSGMEHEKYIDWFKSNRKKNKALPIYKIVDSRVETFLKDRFVIYRQVFINFLVCLGVKK